VGPRRRGNKAQEIPGKNNKPYQGQNTKQKKEQENEEDDP